MGGLLQKLAAARRWIAGILALFLAACVPAWLLAPWVMADFTAMLGGEALYQVFVGEGLAARLTVTAVLAAVAAVHVLALVLLRRFKLRHGLALYAAGAVLFWLGVLFGRAVLVPFTIRFLLNVGRDLFVLHIALFQYVGMCLSLLCAVGVVFLLPIALLALHRAGLVRAASLRRARGRFLLGTAIVMAILTPTQDAVTLVVAVAPVLALYELAVAVLATMERRAALERG